MLIVGPSSTFMSYIKRVLPSLGETGVVMSSLADLYPGVRGVEESDQALAEIKGRLDWVQIIADAVAHRRRTIAEARHIVVDGVKVKVAPENDQPRHRTSQGHPASPTTRPGPPL